jgi:hypothetical protein
MNTARSAIAARRSISISSADWSGAGLDNFGEFALFWNQDLDAVVRHRQDRGQALRRHADMVCEALRGCLPRRELLSAMLLPDGAEKEIDAGFVGACERSRFIAVPLAATAWPICASFCAKSPGFKYLK